MAGTKRRRGGSSRKSAPKAQEPPAHLNAVKRLVSPLFKLQKESSTTVERLWNDETSIKFLSEDFHTSLTAERNDDNEMRPEDTLGYILLLAAQTLERLALNPSENAIAMAWLAFATAPLSCPPQQSDYLSTRAARHVAGRALLASTIAANQALMQLAVKEKKSNHESTAMAILAAILALDTTTGSSLGRDDSVSGTTTRQVRQVWGIARTSLQLHAETYWLEKEQEGADTSNVWDNKMEACWSCIQGVGRDDGSSPSALIDVFAQAIDQYYLITDHGSLSSRWVAMALTMNGEPSWLETSIALLDGPWTEYWSCPVINEIVNPEPATSASVQPVRSRGTDETIDNATMYELSGSVVAVMMVSRMLQIFRAVSRCVGRKFNGNLHFYMNACWSGHSTDKKQDPRDTGVVLLYQILATHRQCLDLMELPVVNDDDNIEGKAALGIYYPFVNDVLELLSVLVSSSPSLSLSHESQVQARNCLDGLAVAFIFQQHTKPNVIDARLIQYAMSQLVKAMSQGRSSHENASWLTKKTFALPLEVPSLSAKSKGQRKKTATKSTFAGMFPGEHGPPHRGDAKLALVLRAISSVCSWDVRCSVLLTLVLDLIKSLYDTRKLEYPPATSTRTAPGDRSRRKPSAVSSLLRNSRSGKRRKLESIEDENMASSQSSWSRMSEVRALACSTALEALALCLRFPHNDQNLTQLQRLLRPSLSSEHMLGIIQLESALSAILPRPVLDDHLINEEEGTLEIFTDREKRLWSSHMNACLTLGRGRVSFRSDDKHVYLGSRRMEVLREISSASSNGGGLLWPLWIPPSHRVIVASNLASEDSQSDVLDAELFIVNGALMSIKEVLKSIATWGFMNSNTENEMIYSGYDEVLLSLDDARLILGAFCRLDKDNRRDSFAKLIHIVHTWIESISERPPDSTRLKNDFEAAGFVSRVITFCSNAYTLMRFGSSVRRELAELIGSSQTSSVLSVGQSPQYCAEKSFMGVLGNWELSDDVSSRLILEDVDTGEEELLKNALEAAFRLGFLTGQIDRGHLLFSAWNGLGKSGLWDMKDEVAPIPQGFVLGESNASSMILELRDDLCLASRLLRKLNSRASSVSPLIAAIDSRMKSESRNKTELSLKIGQCLLTMIDKASALVKIFLDTDVSETRSMAVSQNQCLLHILSTYISFAVSSCTRPKVNFFSNFSALYYRSFQKRKRGNSTESEASSDEDESDVENDEAQHPLEKLEEICSKIGATPGHPDRLDVECSFLDRIKPDMALEIAKKAQRSIAGLLTICIREIKAGQAAVVANQSSFSAAIQSPIVELCWLDHFFDVTPSAEGNESMFDLLSGHLRIESEDLRLATEIVANKIQDRPCIHWSKAAAERCDLFRRNSPGEVDVSTPVLRACNEWQMLLARGLTPACLGLDEVLKASDRTKQIFLEVLGWADALSNIVDCFVPVVSLIHFGLRGGRRLRSSEEQLDVLQRNYEYFRGSLPGAEASDSLKESVQENLAMLAILPMTRSARASVAQLCASEDVLPSLRFFASCARALHILGELRSLIATGKHNEEDLFLCRTIVDRLALVMENKKSEHTLLSVLSGMKFPKVQTVSNVDFDTVFVMRALRRTSYCSRSCTDSILDDEKLGFLRCLTGFLLSGSKLASSRSRTFFVETLYDLIKYSPDAGDDDEDGRLSLVLEILNECKDVALRRLFVEEICSIRDEGDDENESSRTLQGCLCSLFSIVLCKGGRAIRYKKSGVIVKTLLESIENWWGEPQFARAQILNLLLVHASVTSELHLIGRTLFTSYKDNTRPTSIAIEDLCYMFNFVSSLQNSIKENESKTNVRREDEALASLPPVCTYIAFSDFHEQHWYQCYTCGLVGDRGACSLCALVCHKGHDVSYARKSSFFCDCGAEQANDGGTTRLGCKCLKAVSGRSLERKTVNFGSSSKMKDFENVSVYAERIASLYSKESKAALSLFLKKSGFKGASNEIVTALATELKNELHSSASTDRSFQWTYSALRKSLRGRGNAINLDGSVASFEPPLRSFFVDDSLHLVLSSLRQSYLSEKGINRRVVQADSRGRLFIGETNSVLVCNGFAACDFFRHQPESDFEGFSRQSLGILKSIPVHFEIIGLQLAPGNERVLAVWGSHDISVLVMTPTLDGCEQRINLSVSLDNAGLAPGDFTKCQWLSGSARYLAAFCRGMLLFYDIGALDKKPVATLKSPVVDGDENTLQIDDFVCVPIRSDSARTSSSWEVFVVLKDGTLYSTTVTCTCGTQDLVLLCPQISSGQALQIGSVFVDQRPPMETPSQLYFLTQSSLLVIGSYAHGLLIDGDGKIDHSFPILPHRLCVKESGTDIVLTGPFTHWCELGLISDESAPEPFFRVTCIAREESSDRQVLLCVDFNKETTKIKVAQTGQRVSSSIHLDEEDIIGCTAISFPRVERPTSQRAVTLEQAFVCVVTAKGSLITFADDFMTPLKLSIDPVVDEKGNFENRPELFLETEPALLAFERLENISEHGHVFYHGGLMESSDETKTKLLLGNDGFVRSPEMDGFTLNISTNLEVLEESQRVPYLVVAIRVLFGSTDIDAIPHFIIVQGKRFPVLVGEKRWYDVHFTMQDIIAACRCGVIHCFISKTFAGNTKPIVDGIEIYGIKRSAVASWIPSSSTRVASPHIEGTVTRTQRVRLILGGLSNCVSTLSCPAPVLCDQSMLVEVTAEAFLQGDDEIWDSTRQLVETAKVPESERQDHLDNALTSSCLQLLVKLRPGDTEALYIHRPTLRAYIRSVAAVARLRPSSYLRSSSESIALKIRLLLNEEFLCSPSNVDFISDFVELSLLEIAIAKNFLDDFHSREKFAGFGILTPLFACSSLLVVESTARAVLNFCKKYEALSDELPDLFESKPMQVLYLCDICVAPIQGLRYAIDDDENHSLDLCQICYDDALNDAKAKKFSASEDVTFSKEATNEDRPKLTCAEVKRLMAQTVLDNEDTNNVRTQVFKRRQLFNDFIDGLLSSIGNTISIEIEKHDILVSHLIPLMDELSHVSEQSSSSDRAAWLATKLMEGVSRILQRVTPEQLQPSELISNCVQRYVSALSSLTLPDSEARTLLINPISDDESSSKLDDKETTRFQCFHGKAATRHSGTVKNRCFYSCSMKSKAHRCNYFEWSDSSHKRPLFNEIVARKIREMISKPQSGRRFSTQELLCYFLKQLLSTIEASSHEVAKSASQATRQSSSNEVLSDFNDGAFCSKGHVHGSLDVCIIEDQCQRLSSSMTQASSILELLALSGAAGNLWFDPLCAILVSPQENTSSFRPLAKRCLFQICDKSPARYLSTLDSYLFKSRFELLLNKCQDRIDYVLILNKKACQHKRRGQDEESLQWIEMSLGEIVEATDLITEDASLQDCSAGFDKALEELLLHAAKRPMNWKTFCWSKNSKPADSQYCDVNCRPLLEVLALPSLLVGDNRIKAMKLLSLAFSDMETTHASEQMDCGIKEEDIFAFVIRFVCRDESQDARRLALIIACGLCGEAAAARLFARLLKSQLPMIGRMGKLFIEFFALLNALVRATRKEYMDNSMLAAVEHFFCEQTAANHCNQLEGMTYCFEAKKNSAIQKTRFDLVPCGHIVSRPPSKAKVKRHHEQVGQFGSLRLKTDPESTSSNEFNHFLSLPHRCVISEIHVEINDPRGRFVKAINIYYSPRPVNSPPNLKEVEYQALWKPCGRLTLERSAEKASLKLDDPVVASNLRIEFDEFYERPGSHKSDELVVHCPRCSRVVTNAHGVCGSCGEVAFQCRKCRHINYERLNAYLCVECGYCASGGLSYELTAAVATNAVAITNDMDYEEALSMLTSASKLSEDLRLALQVGLNVLSSEHQQHHKSKSAVDESALITRAFNGKLPLKPGSTESKLEMASLKHLDKRGSVVKAIAKTRKCASDTLDNSTSRHPVARHLRGFDRDDFDDASEFFGGLLESSGMGQGLDRLMASVQRQRERNSNRDQAERNARLNQTPPRNGLAECEQLYELMHEAQRECFRLERRIKAWERLETGSLIDDEQESSRGFQPVRCSSCSPLITRQLLQLWHSLFLLDPQSAPINERMLAILLAEDAMSVKDIQEMKRKIVKDIVVMSSKGRSGILKALNRRGMIDGHCAEIIGSVLKEEADAEIVDPFLALADRVLDSDLAL